MVVGIIFSLRDYRAWHYAETVNYGHGNPAETGFTPAQSLGLPYAAFLGKFRLKPPADWTVTENLTLKNMRPSPILPTQTLVEIVRFKDPNSSAQVVVYGRNTTTDLTGLVNAQATGITRDRQYLTVGNTQVTILTWDKPDQVLQKAMLLSNNSFIVIEASSNANVWKTFAKTFLAVYQSWTPV